MAWGEFPGNNSNNPHMETFSQRPPLRDYTNIIPNVDNERLERLIKEKESLMNTGLYSEESRIIRELNLEIEAAKNPLQSTNKPKR